MKKFLSLLLVVVLTATLAVGGTLAYLTDRDSKVNVFTVGDVSIELNEKFDQGSALIPGVDIEKEPTITNTGKNDAWVWAEIAIPAALNDTASAAGNVIHFNMSAASVADGQWDWWNDKVPGEDTYMVKENVDIDGVRYDIYIVQYETALKPGETTENPVIYKVYLDTGVDIDPDGNWAVVKDGVVTKVDWNTNEDGNPVIYVSAYAVQKEGFNTVYDAYKAYQTQWGDNGAEWAETVKVSGADKTAVVNAIADAKDGDIIVLSEDTTIAGANATDKLVIEKAVTLDLNGKTLTTECGWGGIDLKGGASIINGTIKHTGNTAAIKVFQAERIANVTIDVTETAGKTKGGIVVQSGDSYLGSIENVTITGATNGIELYRSTNEAAIGSMKNVTIDATANGIYLNGAGKIGTISNCKINGGSNGINAYLANLWHIALDIENSEITGGVSGIDIWDEAATNTGSTVIFNYDSASTFAGGTNDIKVTLQGEITCTINGAAQTTPCDNRINN